MADVRSRPPAVKRPNNTLDWWLKDDNVCNPGKIWRYTLVDSYTPYKQKFATIMAILKKVQ